MYLLKCSLDGLQYQSFVLKTLTEQNLYYQVLGNSKAVSILIKFVSETKPTAEQCQDMKLTHET